MANNMERRKFLKLAGTAALAVSLTGILGSCGASGSNADENSDMEQIILNAINAARKEEGLQGAAVMVEEIKHYAREWTAQRLEGKTGLGNVVPSGAFGGGYYNSGYGNAWGGLLPGMVTESSMKDNYIKFFRQWAENSKAPVSAQEAVYVGIDATEKDGKIWISVLFGYKL